PKRDMAIVAIAGPATNIILALISYVLLAGVASFEIRDPIGLIIMAIVQSTLQFSVLINLVLAVFNMLPFPPLDGGRIAVGLLPLPAARAWAKLEAFGLFIVVGLLFTGVLDLLLLPVINWAIEVTTF